MFKKISLTPCCLLKLLAVGQRGSHYLCGKTAPYRQVAATSFLSQKTSALRNTSAEKCLNNLIFLTSRSGRVQKVIL